MPRPRGWVWDRRRGGCVHVTGLDNRRIERPRRKHLRPQHAVLGVEQDDAELLHGARAELGQQVTTRRRRIAKMQSRLRPARQRAPPELESSRDLCRARPADAGDARQPIRRRSRETLKAAMHDQQLVRDAQHPTAPRSLADDERDELVVAKRRGAVPQQLLSGPIVQRQFFHRTTAARILESMPPRLLLSLAFLAALTAACADPPDKEMQQAQAAIDAAKAAGADRYAAADFTAAEEALKEANDAVAQRDYRLALNHALDARERAQTAAKDAVDRKAAARIDSDRAVAHASAALGEARARLKAAENAHIQPRALADARRTIASVEQAVQKARAAREREDYLDAMEIVNGATSRLQGVERELEAATPAALRRRH